MIMKTTVAVAAVVVSFAACARTISTGSAECRAGASVTIPVTVDDISGVSAVVLAINTDSTVMTGITVVPGELADPSATLTADDGAGHMSIVITRLAASSGGGELCRIRYKVREGTADLYSDIAFANVQFSAADGVTDLSASNPVIVENGMVRVTATGEDGETDVTIASDDGSLTEETEAAVRDALVATVAEHPEVASVKVKGDVGLIPITASLGIAPHVDILGTEATATYTRPSITITKFNQSTGIVRIRVNPGEGNAIRTTPATGCIHVYGTSDLGEKMRYIGNVEIDLSPYLKAETVGEAEMAVDLGAHTFIKVKAEMVIKNDGDFE